MEMKVFLFSNQASDPAGLSASTPVFNAVGKGGNATVYYSWKIPGEDELANVDRSETVVSPMLPPPRCYYTNVNAQLSIFVRLGGASLLLYFRNLHSVSLNESQVLHREPASHQTLRG